VLTFPLWWTVAYLGDPDNGVIAASYFGSWLMAGGYLALGACVSAMTKNQVIAFVVSVLLSLLFLIPGVPAAKPALQFLLRSDSLVDAVRSFSFLSHFSSIARGVVDIRDLIFFGSLVACFLFMNAIVIEMRKAN
jgi:ABC-2 type transport system permease protein